ncbi:MAG TPA: hypothetical protein VMT20_09900 [Terriglobia bacterium]|nr:hypothetical protein [Terriglobia bacterium]
MEFAVLSGVFQRTLEWPANRDSAEHERAGAESTPGSALRMARLHYRIELVEPAFRNADGREDGTDWR